MKNKLYLQFYGSCALALFASLGYIVRFYPAWLHPFDQTLTEVIRSFYPTGTSFFIWVTKFGNPLTITLLFLTLLFVLLYGKRYTEAIWLSAGTIGIAAIINPLIKLLFMRERPTLEHLVTEQSYSFPSGHSTGSMVFYGTLLLLVPIFIQSKKGQVIVQVVLGLLILTIGISRIYLGVHFPSDILGGFSLGLSWLLFTYPIYQEKRFIWRFKSKQN